MERPLHPTLMLTPGGQAAPQTAREWLIQLHPLDLEQSKIPLTGDRVVLGRAEQCDVRLDDQSISRQHARIQRTAAGCEIVDMGSTNGLFVNDRPTTAAVLQSGDRLRLGKRIFRFLSDTDVEAKYYETVYTMMTRDGLTGAFNKRYLSEFLDREVMRSRKFNRPLSLLLFDVDHFKSVNDTFGHLAGDEVLRELVLRLQRLIGQEEVLGRFGGEEFAIVSELKLDAAMLLAEACRHAVAIEPFSTSAGPLEVTISVGVACPSNTEAWDRDGLIALADSRLYQAKQGGRNRVCA